MEIFLFNGMKSLLNAQFIVFGMFLCFRETVPLLRGSICRMNSFCLWIVWKCKFSQNGPNEKIEKSTDDIEIQSSAKFFMHRAIKIVIAAYILIGLISYYMNPSFRHLFHDGHKNPFHTHERPTRVKNDSHDHLTRPIVFHYEIIMKSVSWAAREFRVSLMGHESWDHGSIMAVSLPLGVAIANTAARMTVSVQLSENIKKSSPWMLQLLFIFSMECVVLHFLSVYKYMRGAYKW